MKELLSLEEPLPRALDVCCGTGLSTVALKALAERVVGVDISPEMLAHGPRDRGVSFCQSAAEDLPFADGAFDLLTVCQGFHWLEREKFFREARRVLRPGGWLVVYDNYFSDGMAGREEFDAWFLAEYLTRFPAPTRNWASFTEEESESVGFHLRAETRLANEISFSLETLVAFIATQSNVIAAVEGKGESLEEVNAWLAEGMGQFYGEAREMVFLFDAPIWSLQRA
ncbi:MAG TPA: class I SAM-dependent methyltransferase [Pyrinomonadaceae bacterium]|nr:class I SAM-dependent methyltransferase [Pyrinomonadaceae bacterium]